MVAKRVECQLVLWICFHSALQALKTLQILGFVGKRECSVVPVICVLARFVLLKIGIIR